MFEAMKKYFQANKPDTAEYSVIKSAYYSDYYQILSGDNPSKLVVAKGLEAFDDMLYDEQVKAALLTKEYAILSTGWEIKPSKNLSVSIATKQADFIKHNFTDWMKGSFNKVLTDLLTFLRYGYVVGEQNYEYDGSSVYLKSIKVRHPNTFKIYPNIYGDLDINSIRQWQTGEVVMPNKNNKFIHYAYRSSFGSPYGRSDLEEAYRDWFMKNSLVKFEAIYLEKFGTPSILTKYTGTKGERDELIKMLSRLRGAGVGVIPKDVEYEIIDATAGGGSHFRKAIEAKDEAISKAILMPNQLGFNKTEVGSNAKAMTHFDIFVWVIQGIQKEIEETIINEQIIRPLINYNFGEQEEYPKFCFNPIKESDKVEIFKLWFEALKGGAVKATVEDENYIRQSIEFPERKEDSELLQEAEPAIEPVLGEPKKKTEEEPDDKDDIEDELEDEKGKVKKFESGQYPVTKNMERVDFKKIDKMFTEQEEQLYKQIDGNIEDMALEAIDRIENKKIVPNKRFDEIDKFQLKYVGDLKMSFKKMFIQIYKDGIVEWKKETPKKEFADQSEIMPDEYTEWLNSKAFMEAGKLADAYKIASKQILITGIENGYSEKKILSDLYQAFSRVAVAGATVKPIFTEARLRNIIRTDINASFNKGRYIQSLDLSEKSKTPIYNLFSEVLEGNDVESHPFSKFIHGKYVLQGTELAQRLQYPMHYQDRGIMLTVDSGVEAIPPDKVLTSMPDLSKYDGLLIS